MAKRKDKAASLRGMLLHLERLVEDWKEADYRARSIGSDVDSEARHAEEDVRAYRERIITQYAPEENAK